MRPFSVKQVSITRRSIAKAPAFTTAAMYVVAGVGAPSYASGAHMWKGTALILNVRPTRMRTRAMMTIVVGPPARTASPMPARSVWPVAPYSSAKP